MKGLSEAIDFKFDSMRGKTYLDFYGDLSDVDPAVIELYDRWDKKALAAGMSFHIVIPHKTKGDWKTEILNGAHALSGQVAMKELEQYTYPGNISIEIAETFVRIGDAKNVTATIIDDQKTADALRHIFEIAWNSGI